MNIQEKILQAKQQDKVYYLARLFYENMGNKTPECGSCFNQFSMILWDLVKDKLDDSFKDNLIGPDIKLAAEYAWRLKNES